MSKTESWKSWVAVIVVLVVFGLFAALWPTLSSGLGMPGFGGGSSTTIPFESTPVTLAIPVVTLPNGTVLGGQTFVMEPWQAMLGLTAVVVSLVVVTGLVVGIVYTLLSRLVVRTTESQSYKENSQALENKEKEKLKSKRQGRPAAPPRADPSMPRWSWFSTLLAALMFVLFGGMAIATTFYPERLVGVDDELFTPGLIIVGIPLLITLALFVFMPRYGTAVIALIIMFFVALATFGAVNFAMTTFDFSLSLTAIVSIIGLVQLLTLLIFAYRWRATPAINFKERMIHADVQGREKGIPYDAIVVLFTGLLILGLGLALMIFINSPYFAGMQ